MPLPRAARVPILRALVKGTFVDVYAYFFGGAGEAMRGRLRSTLAEVDGPVVVIAHSLGSIIAYDVLREAGPPREVSPLVTVGSQLGVTKIQDVVTRRLVVPDGVGAWRNVADGRDLVALDRTIRPEYALAERTINFLVINDSDNHHGIRLYLSTTPVRDAVLAPNPSPCHCSAATRSCSTSRCAPPPPIPTPWPTPWERWPATP